MECELAPKLPNSFKKPKYSFKLPMGLAIFLASSVASVILECLANDYKNHPFWHYETSSTL